MFLPGESQGTGSLVGCYLWGRPELGTTEATWRQQQHIDPNYFLLVRFNSFPLLEDKVRA